MILTTGMAISLANFVVVVVRLNTGGCGTGCGVCNQGKGRAVLDSRSGAASFN